MKVYLDNSATTRAFDQVAELVAHYMTEDYGNPSSLHHMGLVAEKALKKARKQTADAIGTKAENIVFTSGGTEADNLAIIGSALSARRKGSRIITSVTEHPAVLKAFKKLEDEGFDAVYIDVDSDGYVRLDQLKEAVTDDTILISIMHVNNETGTVQPIDDIAAIAAGKENVVLHVDCVQSFGKLPLPVSHADLISVSGHKIHGPMGSGALANITCVKLSPMLFGGGQEKDLRPGTENLPVICGFGLACEMITADMDRKENEIREMRQYLKEGLEKELKDIRINSPEGSCPSVLNISFLDTRGEVILHTLEQEGIYVSTGSACSSNHGGGSHVLKAMGLTEKEITGAIRFSFGRFNSMDEMDYVIEKVKDAVGSFRALGSFR